jgi:hypothetical protein
MRGLLVLIVVVLFGNTAFAQQDSGFTIKPFIENLVVWKYKNILIRVDSTYKGLRYIEWDNGHNASEKTTLLIYGGKMEMDGCGELSFIFKKNKWEYQLSENWCEINDSNGFYLDIIYDSKKMHKYKCKEISHL